MGYPKVVVHSCGLFVPHYQITGVTFLYPHCQHAARVHQPAKACPTILIHPAAHLVPYGGFSG